MNICSSGFRLRTTSVVGPRIADSLCRPADPPRVGAWRCAVLLCLVMFGLGCGVESKEETDIERVDSGSKPSEGRTRKRDESLKEALKHPEQVADLQTYCEDGTLSPGMFERFDSLRTLYIYGDCDFDVDLLLVTIARLPLLNEVALQLPRAQKLPESIGKLGHVEILDLSESLLQDLPGEIGDMTMLRQLDLSWNRLSHLPVDVKRLHRLEELSLTGNSDIDVEETIDLVSELPELKALYLNNLELTHLPKNISKLVHLQILSVRGNNISSLPEELAQLQELRQLYLGYNNPIQLHEDLIADWRKKMPNCDIVVP